MLMNSQGQKLQDNQNTINNLMDRVRELQCEINYMHDSKGFKDVESVHSGQFSHVSSDSASFLLQDERGDLLGRAKIMPLNIWNTLFILGNVFPSPPAYPSSSYERIPTPSRCRKSSREDQYRVTCN